MMIAFMPDDPTTLLIADALNVIVGVLLFISMALVVVLVLIIRRYRKWLDQVGRMRHAWPKAISTSLSM